MDRENTYFIDSANEAELARLLIQDGFFNKGMDLLPQCFAPKRKAKILDLACGPGQWAMAVVDQYPQVHVTGIDISQRMIAWAKAHTREPKQVQFLVGNILERLPFPDQFFDCINARYLFGLMNKDTWRPLIAECFRVSKPDGILRMSETSGNSVPGTNVHHMNTLNYTALWRANKTFAPLDFAVAPLLGLFMEQAGYVVQEEKPYLFNCSYGSEMYGPMVEEFAVYLQLIQPFLKKYLLKEELNDIESVAEEAIKAIHRSDFRAHLLVTSITGKKPPT